MVENRESNSIGVITIGKHFLLSNYGSFFQHWALRHVIAELGGEPYRIADDKEKPDRPYRFLRDGVRGCMAAFWHWLRHGMDLAIECRRARYRMAIGTSFRRDFVRLIGPINETQRERPQAVVIGSDQVWTNLSRQRWGLVVPDGVKLFSYAASGDWREGPSKPGWPEHARMALARLSAVSVREQAGVDVLRSHLGDAFQVVKVSDPVLLRKKEDYLGIVSCKPIFRKPTLLCYIVNIYEASDVYLYKLVALAKKKGLALKVIGLQGMERYTPMKYQMNVSPRDFIRCFRDADCVVTNSFHGLTFCLTLGKQFVCLTQRTRPGTNQNVRQEEILADHNLSFRLLPNTDSIDDIDSVLSLPIDYAAVNAIIRCRRTDSLRFISTALRGKHNF